MRKDLTALDHHDAVSVVDDILGRALDAGATDVHFDPVEAGLLVRIRVDGALADLETLPGALAVSVIGRIKILSSLLTYRVDIPQEGSFIRRNGTNGGDARGTEMRVATIPTIRGERAVVRIFQNSVGLSTLDALGLSEDQVQRLRAAVARPAGFLVASGPAGSGKTTTLYALIRELQDGSPGRSVITLEDPVEQRLDRVSQIQINPCGELSYERCMRSLLRHDPQVILLGEVRDRQTAMLAIEAALTGHLVFTTVHSGDPAETIVRFLEMGIPPYQLTSALTLVCAQRLIRLRCRQCGAAKERGCPACLSTGYAGRTAIAQVAALDDETRSLVIGQATASQLRAAFAKREPDLAARAAVLADRGVTDAEEVGRVLGVALSEG